jgi:hypothetical protein
MKRMKGTHSGENITELMISVLQDYELSPNIGVFVTDNVNSNNSAIKVTLSVLRPDLDARTYRSRCFGYIINLAAKAFIFSKDIAAFKDSLKFEDETAPPDSDKMKAAQEEWRKKGAVGKFHNVIIFIRSSPQRREAFKRCLVDDTNGGKYLALYLMSL